MFKYIKDGKIVGFGNVENNSYESVFMSDDEMLNYEEQQNITSLRMKREEECFSVINRGVLWYNTLTEQQKIELNDWYLAWLDVTETRIAPQKPEWLK